jgi:GHMP kinases N terminal domain
MSDNSTGKLVATAIGAAVAGAALGVAVVKLLDRPKKRDEDISNMLTDRPKRRSFIYEDPMEVRDSSTTLFPHNHEEKMRRRIAARAAVEDENLTPRRSVTVRVPATSANVGPGCKCNTTQHNTNYTVYYCCLFHSHSLSRLFSFYCDHTTQYCTLTDDCIGLAVDLWSEVTVSLADKFEITAEGDGADDVPKDQSNLLVLGVKAAYDTAGKDMPVLKYHVVSRIPYARGLGSSSAAIVAGIIAGLVLAGHRLPCWGSEALLQIAAGIEVCTICAGKHGGSIFCQTPKPNHIVSCFVVVAGPPG